MKSKYQEMKTHKIPMLIAATTLITTIAIQSGFAQDTNLFKANVQLVCVSTNANGNLVYERVGTSKFIKDCASEMGVTNLSGLSLVYDRSNSALEVVSGTGTNLTILCTPLSFGDGLTLSNTNNTVIELQSYVFVETNTVASGTLTATERIFPGTTRHAPSFTLIGQLNYIEPAKGTNAPEICHGSLLVGSVFSHISGESEQGDHNQGDNNQGDNSQGGD